MASTAKKNILWRSLCKSIYPREKVNYVPDRSIHKRSGNEIKSVIFGAKKSKNKHKIGTEDALL